MKPRLPLLLAPLALSASLASAQNIIANFTDGFGPTLADQYPGTAGAGWNNGWQGGTGGSSGTITLSNSAPLNGGGNYLNVVNTRTDGNGSAISRQYTTFGDVDLAGVYTIRFDFRAESTNTGWNGANDYFRFTDRNTAGNDTLASSTFAIQAVSGSANWQFYNGDRAGTSNAAFYTDSGLAFAFGVTYTFTIEVNAPTKSYSVHVTDGTNSVTMSDLGWRTGNATGGHLHFVSRRDNTGDVREFSFDSISIGVIPEPSAFAALAGLAALGLAASRRRRS